MFALRDQLTLSTAHLYLRDQTIDPFVFFANNVSLRSQLTLTEENSIEKTNEAVEKAYSVFGIKIISPLKTLLLRMLEANLGFIELHTTFLKICNILSPSDALPILQYPGLFKRMKKTDQMLFLVEACNIYIKLRKYALAYEAIAKAAKVDCTKEGKYQVYYRLIVLSLNQVKSLSEYSDGIKIFCARMESTLDKESTKQQINNFEILRFYLSLKEWRVLNENERKVLNHENLVDAYNEARYAKLGRYIENEIKGLNWRIKADSIKNQPIGELEIIKAVNHSKQIYKYDAQEKMMYFNHKVCDQNSLNQLISKAFLMQNEANNCKIEKKEAEFRGGMGMGGMGGMGGFGGILDMMMGGSKKRREHHHDFDDEM